MITTTTATATDGTEAPADPAVQAVQAAFIALLVDCDTEEEIAELLIAIDGMIEQQDGDAEAGEAAP